jgi:hypothetical protein
VVHHEGHGMAAAAMVYWCAVCVFYLTFTWVKRVSDVSNAKSNQQPTTYPPNYLHELLVDEGVLSSYPLRMLVRKPPMPW